MEGMRQEERLGDFCRIYGQMENEDKEKVVLAAKKLLLAQKTIKAENGLDMENEDVSV